MSSVTTSGNTPVIISVPHDGHIILPDVPLTAESVNWLREGHDGRDYGTSVCAQVCHKAMKLAGLTPTLVCFQISRSQIDVNRDPEREPYVIGEEGRNDFCVAAYREFHAMVEHQIKLCLLSWQYCLLVDLHSFEDFRMGGADIVFGTKEGRLCPTNWSESLFHHLSKSDNPTLKRAYRVTYSPDRAKGVGGGLSGGYVVRRAIAALPSARDAGYLGGIQIEVRRQPFFLEHPEVIGAHLAKALLDWLDKMR